MLRVHCLWASFLVVSLAGCNCKGSTDIDGGGAGSAFAGGTGANGGGSGNGSGGGASNGGGGADNRIFDAGDGTTASGVEPGGFSLDGGVDGTGDGVTVDPNGNVVLNAGSTQFYFMWIANADNGWVSKYDTRTGKEVGRYFSVIPKDCSNSPMGPPCTGGQVHDLRANRSYSPSRTAIDVFGDVWVANRAPYSQGSVTKIATDIGSCIDRNRNGKIDTSSDLNGDGQISIAEGEMIIPSDPSDPNTYDECVLFTQKVGSAGGEVNGRALAVGAGLEGGAGDIWVGIYAEKKMYRLNALTGEIIPVSAGGPMSLDVPIGPYGAIVDRSQKLWIVTIDSGRIALIDTATATVLDGNIQSPDCSAYGLGIDGKGRLWIPGYRQKAVACRYDVSTKSWKTFDFSAARGPNNEKFTVGRGIAIDTAGKVYMTGTLGSQLIRFDSETGAVIPFGTSQFIEFTDEKTTTAVGVGLDADGHPWVNNYSGNVTKADKVTGAVTKTAQQPKGLYTYSDFTGYQLRNFTAPRGVYSKDFEACDTDNEWRALTWVADVPANASLQVFVKGADTRALLDSTATMRYGPFTTSPTDLLAAGVPKSKFLRVEFNLRSTDSKGTPVLKSFNLVWACNGIK
jgi:hypothetical protein